MTPGFCPVLLLLLLGLWVAEVPVSAKPKNKTPAQWFEIQHVQPSPQGCNKAMGSINKHSRHCKNLNTFLHDSFSNVASTCQTKSMTCKNRHKNCHKSQRPVSLTLCELTSGRYPNCKYKEKHRNAHYIVACNPPQKGDSGHLQLVPVHLDRVL
ncbi:ribonuclease 7 [Choloepus didactylus]|uniref:ribonuclease 7 n=1 Tax=Choloepus didactylus TaxID=27675 RepID=UPI00189DE2A7|nr:ribonuclease 7 [Choloepus didactylus]XP_037690385.1 ribonuclease 7 [Choloepus didactylus]